MSEWKDCMNGLLGGVERELLPSELDETGDTFQEFKKRLKRIRVNRERLRFDHELEFFLEGRDYLVQATERYLSKIAVPAIEEAVATMRRAYQVLAEGQKRSLLYQGTRRKGKKLRPC
jgi:succinate dehydrogenase/fumarate reductase flavoprotein subunit